MSALCDESGQCTVGAEHGGSHRSARTQQLPAHSSSQAASILGQQRHSVPILIEDGVLVALQRTVISASKACLLLRAYAMVSASRSLAVLDVTAFMQYAVFGSTFC